MKRNQDNEKKIINRYQEMSNNDKRPKGTSVKQMELRLKYGNCKICKKALEVGDWCKDCETRKLKQNFENWTSGYPKIDQLIRESQLSAKDSLDYFEWIDYKEIMNVEYITEGGSGKIFKGVWTRGPMHQLDNKRQNWINDPNTEVALKEITSIDWKKDEKEFNQLLKEVQNHQKFLPNKEDHVLRCFGITKSPGDDIKITKWLDPCSKKRPNPNSYIMVMKWAGGGDLSYYIKNKARDEKFTWYRRLEILEDLSGALKSIHSKNMVHKDLHCGNILMDDKDKFHFPAISDLGLCGSFNNKIIGVISFIAPEILIGDSKFTPASDIYSFGIIMWVICCCELPYKEPLNSLGINIICGYRPKIPKDIPPAYLDLMKKCWDDDSTKRPKAKDLRDRFTEWKNQYHSNNSEFFIAEKERLNRIKHPDLFDVFEDQVYKKPNNYAYFQPSDIIEEINKINYEKVEI